MPQHLLVVDDDPDILRILTEFLEDEGYAVETASDGLDALAKIESVVPDLVLLDLEMPRLDGVEFLRCVSNLPEVPPSIVISGHDSRHMARAAGAAGFVAKPIDFEGLLSSVASVLRTSSSTKVDP